ncbi:hypothetical protein MMC07_006844, partial [Pseudocyphellaria aurata]|nr:hypothetical protein [Pseudocyphellaria aurata]
MSQYYYPPTNPLVYPGTSDGYFSCPTAADMTPCQSQNSDSSYGSGMASPVSPQGPYPPSTGHNVSHSRQCTGYEYSSSHRSDGHNPGGWPPQTSSSTRTQT